MKINIEICKKEVIMKKLISILLSAVIAFSIQSTAFAALSQKVNFQGQITTTSGSPVTGTQAMVFTIYNTLTGGTALKTISNSQVTFSASGVYSVQLDLSGINLNQDLWLGVTLGTDAEMTPRVQILPTPSSIFSISTDRAYGEMYATANATPTTVASPNVFVLMATPTTVGPLNNFTHTSGRLTYNGTDTKKFRINICASFQSAAVAGTIASFTIYKNGSPITESQIQQDLAAASKNFSVGLVTLASLNTNDYIELYVTTSIAASLTVSYFSCVITEI